ncbi:MAG: hypothetical protein ACKOF7_01135, partial [Phycisphaerales bacterium]
AMLCVAQAIADLYGGKDAPADARAMRIRLPAGMLRATVTVGGASSIAIPEDGRTIALPPGPPGARTVVIEP